MVLPALLRNELLATAEGSPGLSAVVAATVAAATKPIATSRTDLGSPPSMTHPPIRLPPPGVAPSDSSPSYRCRERRAAPLAARRGACRSWRAGDRVGAGPVMRPGPAPRRGGRC